MAALPWSTATRAVLLSSMTRVALRSAMHQKSTSTENALGMYKGQRYTSSNDR
jgi:hypothetical protein